MSKFFITNNQGLSQRIMQDVEESAYQASFVFNEDGIYAVSTKKLAVDNVNGKRCGDGFTIVTGTLSYGNGMPVNETTLHRIYQEFENNVNFIRQDCLGNYGISIYKNKVLYVFGEIPGFYNIYYYKKDNDWLISNSLYDIAIVLKDRITLNKMALLESIVQEGILLGDTYFNEIHRLCGFNYLRIERESVQVIEDECLYPLAEGSLDNKVKRFTDLLHNYAQKMVLAFGDPAISMTGGLDARMVLSSYLSADANPHLYYGTGNSFITNTYNEDKEIDIAFSEKYGLVFHDEKWGTPIPLDKYWDDYLEIFGFSYDTYAGSKEVNESIINTPCDHFTYGYCGELFRSLPWIESRTKPFFTIDEYAEEFYVPQKLKNEIVEVGEYMSYIKNKISIICEHYLLDPNHIPNEDIFYLSLERRKSADSVMLNHVNLIKYCSYILGQYGCLVAGRVTCEEANDSCFMLHCLDTLYPSVLDVPVFSHCTMRNFYRETMRLNPQNRPVSWRDRIKKYVTSRFPRIVSFGRRLLRNKHFGRFPMDEHINNYLFSFLKDKQYCDGIYIERISDMRRLISYVMKNKAIESVFSIKQNDRHD